MYIFGVWILLTSAIRVSKQECFLPSLYSFDCSNTSPGELLYDLFKHNHTVEAMTKRSIFDLNIKNSKFLEIYSFYFLIPWKNFILKRLAIVNSSVGFIDDWAFESFSTVTDLALSNNNLQNLSFVNTLPTNLEKLYLDGNKFTIVTNVFHQLGRLTYLDLSNCKIHEIEPNSFSSFYNDIFISVRNNQLTSFDVFFKDGLKLELDLSYNNIKYIQSKEKRILIRGLRASHNKIERISDISCQDCGYGYYRRTIKYIDLSFNDFRNATSLNFFSAIKAENINLSNSKIDDNFNYEILKFVKSNVDLSNNNLKIIKPIMLGYELELVNLLLTNSSIYNIETEAFKNYKLDILNVSYNFITSLKNSTFDRSFIKILDLSHCLIEKIDPYTFSGLILTNTLDLSHNKLTYLNQIIFQNLSDVLKIDLSFNLLKKLDNNLFANCAKLRILNLANSKIEVIRTLTFAGTLNLFELYLQNNLITNIQFQTFNVPYSVNLKNNSMSHLNFSFLKNLSATVIILSNNNLQKLTNSSIPVVGLAKELDLSRSNIHNIVINAFEGLSSLEILDLSNNFLKEIGSGTFIPLKKLKTLYLFGNNIVTFSSNVFVFGNQLNMLVISFFDTFLHSDTFMYLNQLKILEISNSSFSSLEKNSFKGLIYLENLILHDVEANTIAPGAFEGLYNLRYANFKMLYQNIDTVQAGAFRSLQSLRELDLSHLNLTTLEPQAFVGLPILKKLQLNNNNLEKIHDYTFLELDSLKMLILSNNKITILEPNGFAGLINLEELYLSNNNLSKLDLGTFQKFSNLRILNLQKNHINKILTGIFSNLKLLDHLDLSYNNITKLKMHNFMSLTNLKTLDFTGNHLIQMSHLDFIRSLRNLQFVGLNDNKWKCDNLSLMLTAFQNYSIEWVSEKSATFDHENIDGIKCYDICKFFYCVDEQDTVGQIV